MARDHCRTSARRGRFRKPGCRSFQRREVCRRCCGLSPCSRIEPASGRHFAQLGPGGVQAGTLCRGHCSAQGSSAGRPRQRTGEDPAGNELFRRRQVRGCDSIPAIRGHQIARQHRAAWRAGPELPECTAVQLRAGRVSADCSGESRQRAGAHSARRSAGWAETEGPGHNGIPGRGEGSLPRSRAFISDWGIFFGPSCNMRRPPRSFSWNSGTIRTMPRR
jgi:hypothetical protein